VSTIHLIFLAVTILAPIILSLTSRRLKSERFDRIVERTIALLLLAAAAWEYFYKGVIERQPFAGILPMHLCDWALVITAIALWRRSQRFFEVAYFWGLAGTIQGLLTPAIDATLAVWRHLTFFTVHSGIVIGVLFLVFARRMRPVPASLPRVLFWSELFLLVALLVNHLTGQNYGFLSHPPSTPSLLDTFPSNSLLYVVTINAVALFAFTLLYLPWWIADLRRARPVAPL
jgi:hypothetical integral membrane protein (TIGR02206 family)